MGRKFIVPEEFLEELKNAVRLNYNTKKMIHQLNGTYTCTYEDYGLTNEDIKRAENLLNIIKDL